MLLTAFQIAAAVVAYRLRRLEMANLAGAASIAAALHLPPLEIGLRTLFAFFLNALVYLNNDYSDVQIDLSSKDKDAIKTRFLAGHLREALLAQWLLLGLLLAAALAFQPGLLFPLLAGGGLCLAYSGYLKRRPYVDIPAMMAWGALMPLCGAPLGSVLGWCLALQLGLFSAVFETIQVLRDADDDAAEGVRTTAVVLGKPRTVLLVRALMVLASLYAVLVLDPLPGALSALVLAVPFDERAVARYWTRVKFVYGVAWLWICALVYLRARSQGLLFSADLLARF
jgi:4-hydroxybenzoate polyprenyltransferase